MKRLQSLLSIILLLIAIAINPACKRQAESITVAGSTAFQPFAEKLAEQFMNATPGASITVQGGGSSVGIQSALSGAAQIGMADLVELPADAKNLKQFLVARDGIVLIAHPKNKVTNLSLSQLRDIFNGKIKNWKSFGGDDKPITVVSREAGSGTRSSFEVIVKDITLINEAIIQDSNGTVRETIANDANAIGYISHGLVNDKIKALSIEGATCTNNEITSGKYPLVRPVFLLVKNEPAGTIKAFIDYILSKEGQDTISNSGLLPAVAK